MSRETIVPASAAALVFNADGTVEAHLPYMDEDAECPAHVMDAAELMFLLSDAPVAVRLREALQAAFVAAGEDDAEPRTWN